MAVWSRTCAKYDLSQGEVKALWDLVASGDIHLLRKLIARHIEPCEGILRSSRSWEEVQRTQGVVIGLEALLAEIERIADDAKNEEKGGFK